MKQLRFLIPFIILDIVATLYLLLSYLIFEQFALYILILLILFVGLIAMTIYLVCLIIIQQKKNYCTLHDDIEEVKEIIRETPEKQEKIFSALDYIKNDTWKLSENPLHDISENYYDPPLF